MPASLQYRLWRKLVTVFYLEWKGFQKDGHERGEKEEKEGGTGEFPVALA